MEIGTTLQKARIDKGFTLAHVSNVTKISSRVLELIEANAFVQLPGGLVTRGYLRAFASEVGLNPESVVDEYRAQGGSASAEEEPFKVRRSYVDEDARVPHGALVLIVGFVILIYFAYPRPVHPPSGMEITADTSEMNADGAATIGAAVAASAGSAPIAPPRVAAADSDGLQIELWPQAECWLSAVADGHLVMYRLMNSGERETINARDEIVLRVGDAGALAYFVNGEMGRSLGAAGEAVTVRITSGDWATWAPQETDL